MAARSEGVEKRPANLNVNADEETRVDPTDVADGVDDATRDLILHDTTTRERTVNAKRAHEPLDKDAADERQPAEDGNGPRAAEIEPGKGPTETKSTVTVSEGQVKKGAPGV
jgi:hypothetical protein